MRPGTHEDYSRETAQRSSSDRSFGLVFAAFFLLMGGWPVVKGNPPRVWALALAAVFLALAFGAPAVLKPLNRLWTALGVLLAKITNPIVTGLMFFGLFTPAGLLMRLMGKDPLRLRPDSAAESYWILRDPPGPAPDSMRNQF